jgi:thiol-disulfide isomerase/thioredoxin
MAAADLRVVQQAAAVHPAVPSQTPLRLVNVWATWCIPCVDEMPDLQRIHSELGKDVAVIGISLDDMVPDSKKEKVAGFLDKQKITFPNIYYTGKPDDLGDLLRFSGEIPITIVYDRQGKELWRHQGRLNREKTLAELRGLLRRIR